MIKLAYCCTVISLLANNLLGQDGKEGRIIFGEVIQMKIQLEGEAAQYSDMLPKSRSNQFELLFNEEETLFRGLEKEEDVVEQSSGGMQFKMVMKMPQNITYHSIKDNREVNQRDFMGKIFLIQKESKASGWKMGGPSRRVLGYDCMQASMIEGADTVKAWFSPQIPVSAGPSNYFGLPGMVLAADINDGKRVIVAEEIQFFELENGDIAAPIKGKKVTQEAYEKIVEEKMKEMQMEHGGSGNMIIRIKN